MIGYTAWFIIDVAGVGSTGDQMRGLCFGGWKAAREEWESNEGEEGSEMHGWSFCG